MNRRLAVVTTLAVFVLAPSARAKPVSVTEADHNTQHTENEQTNTGVVNQSAVFPIGEAATFRIEDVKCSSPAFVGSANYSNWSGGYSNGSYSISASFVFPLGGDECEEAMKYKKERIATSNEVNVARVCAEFKRKDIKLSPEQYPRLSKKCEGLKISP